MFERPLYEYEPVAAPLQESDLFHNYEIKGWASAPGLFKVIGLSAVVNIVALLVVAQTSLLTTKGCDSPFVGSVCQVLDTVYVGSLLFGTDREFVDVAYERTDLGEDAEITYIDVSNITPPLKYPAGYFEIANPEQAALMEEIVEGNPFVYSNPGFQGGFQNPPAGIPLSEPNGESLFDTPQNLPQPNPNVIDPSTLPGNPNGGGVYFPPVTSPNRRNGRNKRPPLGRVDPEGAIAGIPDANSNTVAEKQTPSASPTPQATVEATAPVDAINTRPFKDTLIKVLDLLDKKQLDLQAPIHLLATAKLAKDGKIAKGSFRVTGADGDKQLGMTVTDLLAAFNDSNLLYHLKDLSGKDISFLVQQDQTSVIAAIKSQTESDTRAHSLESTLKLSLGVIIGTKEDKIKEAESDPAKAADLPKLREDVALLKSIQISTSGKEIIIGFASPKQQVQQWIATRLAEQRAEPKPTEATGGVPPKPADPAQK